MVLFENFDMSLASWVDYLLPQIIFDRFGGMASHRIRILSLVD